MKKAFLLVVVLSLFFANCSEKNYADISQKDINTAKKQMESWKINM